MDDADNKRRLHWLMYGMYYPAVLGTGIVELLRHAQTILSSEVSVAVTAGAFFSLSFASAAGLEDDYGWVAFTLDIAEVLGMFACFVCLGIIELPLKISPSISSAYVILACVVGSQFLWRAAMGLQWNAYLDLKIMFLALLVAGAVEGRHRVATNWAITVAFSLLALLYVSLGPYKKTEKLKKSYLLKLLDCQPGGDSESW